MEEDFRAILAMLVFASKAYWIRVFIREIEIPFLS